MKTKIMFVCHGNICRSPMAEFIFKKLLEEKGIGKDFTVCSSATSREELGNPIYPPALRELRKHGIEPSSKYAVQLERSDYGRYDLFVGMDRANIRNMYNIFGGDPENKVIKLMDMTGRGGDVADPWYTGDFSATYRDCFEGCAALLNYILEEKRKKS